MKQMMIFPSLDDDEHKIRLVLPISEVHGYHFYLAKAAEDITNEQCWFELSTITRGGKKISSKTLMTEYLKLVNVNIDKVIFTDCESIKQRAKVFQHSYIIYPVTSLIKHFTHMDVWDCLLECNIRLISVWKNEICWPSHQFFQQPIVNLYAKYQDSIRIAV